MVRFIFEFVGRLIASVSPIYLLTDYLGVDNIVGNQMNMVSFFLLTAFLGIWTFLPLLDSNN